MPELIHKELCYKIYGVSYAVQKVMGSVYSEKQYQNAFEMKLKVEKLLYEREKDVG